MNNKIRFTEQSPLRGGLPYTRTERVILWLLICASVTGSVGMGWLIVALLQWLTAR